MTARPKVLDLPGASRRQHVTAVALLADGRAVVGEEAIRADDVARLWLAFKSRNLDDPDTRSPMQLLVKQIVADIVDNGTIPDQSAVRWVFGAPLGWMPEHYAAYERLLDEIGLSDHAVIAESRAALLYARDSGEVDVMGNSEAGRPRQRRSRRRVDRPRDPAARRRPSSAPRRADRPPWPKSAERSEAGAGLPGEQRQVLP